MASELEQMPWIDKRYKGSLIVGFPLYKNKWNSTIGLLFGKYILRHFILYMDQQIFCHHDEAHPKNPHTYDLNVIFLFDFNSLL